MIHQEEKTEGTNFYCCLNKCFLYFILISRVFTYFLLFACVLSHFSPVGLFATLWPTSLLYPWDSPGKNTGVGCHVLLQGISPTQRLNPSLLHPLHWQAGSFPLSPLGKPKV